MDERGAAQRQVEYRRQLFDDCRGRQFVRKSFVSYPSLRSIAGSEDGWYVSEPYTGQDYDPDKFWVCEGDWDHEHCYVCNAHIEPGD